MSDQISAVAVRPFCGSVSFVKVVKYTGPAIVSRSLTFCYLIKNPVMTMIDPENRNFGVFDGI